MSETTARNYIEQAIESAAAGNLSEAFDLYLGAFNIFPPLKAIYKTKFQAVFTRLVDYLDENDDNNAFFEVCRQALTVFPGNSDILSEIGRYLLKNRFYMEAWGQFQQILNEDSSSVVAEHYLNIVKIALVERWHYRMLNDKTRNFSYRAAIREIVQPDKDSVLDLGAGTGLLSMYASKCNPATIVGIEKSSILSEIANRVLEDNHFHSITVINNSSNNVSDLDIGGRKSLLVTELFDAGLIGEGILPTLDHAFKHLLFNNGRVIPSRVEFFIRGIKSDSLMSRYYLNKCVKALLSIPLNKHVLAYHNSYDCGDIHLYADLKYMTEPQSVIELDLNNAEDIEIKLSRIEESSIPLKPMENGEVSTIIGWFNLHLTDNVTITTDPTSENRANAWQQAIFCNFVPKQVQRNNPFTVGFRMLKGLRLVMLPDTAADMKISEYVMRFLNDEKYIETIIDCAATAFVYLQHFTIEEADVADMSPFPFFGLMMLKGGVQSLHCHARTKYDEHFFESVFQANGISRERYKILDNEQEFLGDTKFHAIYYNIFTDVGNVDSALLKITHCMEVNNLVNGGLFIPYSTRVIGQLINGPCLDWYNRVSDENTGYKIAQHMNKFQASVNYGIDFSQFDFTVISNPIVLGYCGSMKSGVVECPVVTDGSANAILCWYEIKLLQDGEHITTRRRNSCIDGMAFLADPHVLLVTGDIPDIICCVDNDQSFKLLIDMSD